MPAAMSSNDYILLGALIGVLVFLLGYWTGRREQKTPRGIPAYNPPPEPPPARPRWRTLEVKDLKEGEVYRCRFTQQRVKVNRLRLFKPDQRHLRDVADCVRWNDVNGKEVEAHYYNHELETDNEMLVPRDVERILKQGL